MPRPAAPWRGDAPLRRPPRRRASCTAPPRRSPSASRSTLARATAPSADFSILKWCSARAAICGRWVMHMTWRSAPSARRRSPTARAVWPPTPASTSSKINVPAPPAPATVISASITRDSSPPDAVSRTGAAGTPGLGASMNSTRSAPPAPISSRGSSSTANDAPSIARKASSATTRRASSGAARLAAGR